MKFLKINLMVFGVIVLTGCANLNNSSCYVDAVVNPVIIAAQKHIDPDIIVYPNRDCQF